MPECRLCGAEILFAVNAKGRRQPIDLEPRPDGNLATYRDHLSRLRCRSVTVKDPIQAYERPAMPHQATCPGVAKVPVSDESGVARLSVARDARRRRLLAERHQL